MSSLDIEALLAEISPDAPCGKDLEYDADFLELEKRLQGTPERLDQPAQPPSWRDVHKSALALLKRTRDLRVILALQQGLLNAEGLSGFSDGLRLIQGTVERYWPELYPLLDPDDDNDPTSRINILMSLCDFDAFINPLAKIPLIESRAVGRFSWRDVQIASGKMAAPAGETPVVLTTIEAACLDCELESLQTTEQCLSDSLACLTDIENYLTDQVGSEFAPNFSSLASELKEMRFFLRKQLERRAGEIADIAVEEGADAVEGFAAPVSGTAVRTPTNGIQSRQDVIRTLDLICDYYTKYEPSSPVPLLLNRAKRLVTKNFLEILQDMAPGGLAQIEVIKGQSEESAG